MGTQPKDEIYAADALPPPGDGRHHGF